ncbi:MAG: alpha-galactosidase [Paludibacteraceae bacterium]|nr:alpha-galactosidase [Paludibacteraceae bacterium]
MKKSLYILLAAAALLGTACSSKPDTERLYCAETEMASFPFKQDGFNIVKQQTVKPVEGVPGLEVIETAFINLGKPVTVKAYDLCRFEMPAKDTVVWSLQPTSSNARLDWVLPVTEGFAKENYLGMNNSDYGGGIPVLDLWQRDGGVAIGLFEPVLRMISMPVEWKRYDNKVSARLHYNLPEPVMLETGDTLQCFRAFRLTHEGDYFNALRIFSDYMQANLGIEMQPSEPEAFEPVWCAWGYGRPFKMNMVLGTLDKVADLGFTWVDIDDGYQIAEGDWNTNQYFPGGDADMRHITDEVHKRGMKAKLWWAPLAADPDTKLVKEHPEMLLLTDEWAHEYITWWDSWYLSPINPATDAYTRDLLNMFLRRWNFDGLKIDGQHLNCCLPDYNENTGLESAWEAPEKMYTYYEKIYKEARQYKPDAVIQICPCGCAVNYWIIPQINQAVASDPMSSRQVRMKRKAYAALAPNLAYYGDHIELTDGGNDFASQIGTGSVIGTKFTWPKDNPDWSEGPFLLTPEKEALLRKWMKIYKENNLARGEYLNLYTWGYDYPEAHVIRQNGSLYYAFYVDPVAPEGAMDPSHVDAVTVPVPSFEGTLELRGLNPDKTYTALEYTADEPRSFTVEGSNPFIDVNFERSYLLKLTEKLER